MSKNADFLVVGAGLAGSEAALTLAQMNFNVRIYEQKPLQFSPAHKLPGAAELVCSNSLKSQELTASHGLLKEELRLLGSPLLQAAVESRIPGGKALTVNREEFSRRVSESLANHPRIEWIREPLNEIPTDPSLPTLIATGPLSSDELTKSLKSFLKDDGLYFYDATSPVVSLESLDLSKFFWGNRNQDGDDYLNLPLSKEQYLEFRENVLSAEKVQSHLLGEELKFFEGCLPLEVIAERGEDTLACSCMSADGFRGKAPEGTYALIQFRREKAAGELLSMVAFQTRMKWPEQERVFRSLPGMQNAEFVRLGAMHRNTFINAPRHLNESLQLKKSPHLYFAGQITGAEGYCEALVTGHYAALQMAQVPSLPETSGIRSLVRFLVNSDPQHFQPMNFNLGLLPPLEIQRKIKKGPRYLKKAQRNLDKAERALKDVIAWGETNTSKLGNLWQGGSQTFLSLEALRRTLVGTPTEPSKSTAAA